jgi:hypothetical protein
MLTNKKHCFRIQLETSGRPPIGLPAVLISDSDALCGDATPNTVYIEYQVNNVLTLNDVLYNESAGTIVFIGGDNRYVITIDGGITTYAITVTNLGVIDSITLCEVPLPRILVQLSDGLITPTDCSDATTSFNAYTTLSNPLNLTSADIMYANETNFTFFNGGGLYYTANVPSLSKKYLVTISSVGAVNVLSLCI